MEEGQEPGTKLACSLANKTRNWLYLLGMVYWKDTMDEKKPRHYGREKTDLPTMREVICRQPGRQQQGSQDKNLLDLSAERGTPIILPEVADKSFMLAGFPVAQQRRHHREGDDRQGCGDLGTGEYVG